MESRQSDRVREKEGMRRSATYPKGGHYRGVESKVAGANSAAVYVPPRHRGPEGSEGEVIGGRVDRLLGTETRPAPLSLDPEVLDAPPGRVYTGDMTTPTQDPEFEPDQIAQAVSVGLCFVLAAVLLVLVLV